MFFRILGAFLLGSLLLPVVRLLLWIVVLVVVAALPGVLWATYVDLSPSREFMAALNGAMLVLVLVVGVAIAIVVRRGRQRRRLHEAVYYVLDVKHGRA